MKYTILSVAFPLAPVRQDTAGGAEQVLSMIDSALMREGHRSVVVACEGSKPAGIHVKTPGINSTIDPKVEDFVHEKYREAIDKALSKYNVDLVHMHGIDFQNYLPASDVPVLVTLHLPPSWYPEEALRTQRPSTYFNCVSGSQQENCPQVPSLMPYIENGIVLSNYNIKVRKRNFAMSLGRICLEKGFHFSADAAKLAGVPLVIAGELFAYEYHQDYYKTELLPRLDGKDYKFIGPVGLQKKKRLLAAARCLLVPSLVPETSSLVAMEAMASGTPVIAYPQGALKEIVEHGKTGFLVNNVHEMAQAIRAADTISPEVCRLTAKERFSSERMLRSYFELYDLIIGKTKNPSHRKNELSRQVANE